MAHSGHLNYNLDASPSGFQLTGGHIKELLGTQMAHFVFQNGEKVVSVFVVDSKSYKIPDDLQATAVTIGDITFYKLDTGSDRFQVFRATCSEIIEDPHFKALVYESFN